MGSLLWWEPANVPLQGLIWFGLLGIPLTAANIVGFALLAVLLLEGAGYWLAKLRQVTVVASPLPVARFFAVARVVDVPWLVAGLLFSGVGASGASQATRGVRESPGH